MEGGTGGINDITCEQQSQVTGITVGNINKTETIKNIRRNKTENKGNEYCEKSIVYYKMSLVMPRIIWNKYQQDRRKDIKINKINNRNEFVKTKLFVEICNE